jgi:hypothetical protein
MRRTLALLALLATAWPHVAALECALAQPLAHEAQAVGHEHSASAHDVPATTEAHGATTHQGSAAGGLDCELVMACGLAMIRADAVASGPQLPSPLAAVRSTTLDAPLAAVLVADPPPPRRIA